MPLHTQKLGLVRSPLMTTALQVFSRVALVWVVTWPYEEVQRGQLTVFRCGLGARARPRGGPRASREKAAGQLTPPARAPLARR